MVLRALDVHAAAGKLDRDDVARVHEAIQAALANIPIDPVTKAVAEIDQAERDPS